MKILVVGSGGNGQSYFMKFLRKNKIEINDEHDRDNIKHLSSPKFLNITDKKIRIIFLYNHPYMAIQSHFRRDWGYKQLTKLGNPYNLQLDDVENINTFNQKFLQQKKKDLYGIEDQFYNWLNSDLQFPIYFLNFNDIINEKKNINKFVKKELNYSLFNYSSRNSRNNNSLKLYEKIYAKMNKKSKKNNIKMMYT